MRSRLWLSAQAAGLLLAVPLTVFGQVSGPAVGVVAPPEGDPFPGLYLTDDLEVIESDEGFLRVASGLPCADVAAILASGQWSLHDQMVLPEGTPAGLLEMMGLRPVSVLRQGDRYAVASLEGDRTCLVSLVDASGPLAIEMAGQRTEGGWVAASRCIAYEGGLGVSLSYDDGQGRGGMLNLDLEGSGPQRTAALNDTTGSTLMDLGDGRLFGTFSGLMDAALAGDEDVAGGAVELFQPEDTSGRGQIGDGPHPQASFDIEVEDDLGRPVRIAASFRCPAVTPVG